MTSGTSDLTVIPNQEVDESSMVSDPSIQASLQRTSAAVSENIAAGDDLSAGMEPSLPVASSKSSEIIEAEDDPSPGMEPSLQTSPLRDPAEDKQSSGTSSTSSLNTKVNPYVKDLSPAKYDKEGLRKHFDELERKLGDGLEEKAWFAVLDVNNMTEAQEKVQELFYLFESIEFVISNWTSLLKIQIPKADSYGLIFKAGYLRIDIYHHLFIHALDYAQKLRENPSVGLSPLPTITLASLSEYFEATEFMVFLINKVQEEGEIMKLLHPQLDNQTKYEPESAEAFVTKCVLKYEEETISTFICLVVNDEGEEAEDLFKSLLKHMKPSDIINCGRVYNYALQKVQELHKVCTFLSSPKLSKRYKDVQCNDRLNGLAMEHDNQVKVQRFLVDLYLRHDNLQQQLDWKFVEEHDYCYLIKCVWEHHKSREPENGVEQYNWPQLLQLTYVFTSIAAWLVPGGIDIMKCLLEAWPTLVNAPYKGVAALYVAVIHGNEEAIAYLLQQKELDINVRTGRLFTPGEVKKYWEDDKGVRKFTRVPPLYAIVDASVDRRELIQGHLPQQLIEGNSDDPLDATKKSSRQRIAISGKKQKHIKDHLDQQHIEGNSDDPLDATKKSSWLKIAISGKMWKHIKDHLDQQHIEGNSDGPQGATKKLSWQRMAMSGKKWNKNRWNLPTYQTALHIATSQRDTMAVKLLCNAPDPHQQRLRCHEEDEKERTPLNILYNGRGKVGEPFAFSEIERTLLSEQDVRNGIDGLYRHRQDLVDAVNTILVAAALIAGVTFAGWLQPPLGYAQYYDHAMPYPAPPNTYDSYLPVQGNLGVKVFALFNSLSFFFAIATIIAGADAAFPAFPAQTNQNIREVVETMSSLHQRAIRFLMISLVCVLGAFSSAAVVVLPPSLFFRKDLVLSIIIGVGVCGYTLWQFLSRHFKKMQKFNAYIRSIIKFTNVF